MLLVYRFAPSPSPEKRLAEYMSDAAFPVPQYTRLRPGSNDPVIQVAPPPYLQLSPFQVSLPFSPLPGIVKKRHARRPVLASKAVKYPRNALSPPAVPTITLSLTKSGAAVMLHPHCFESLVAAFHTSAPVF